MAHRQSEERDICLRALLTKEAAADAVIIRGVCDRGLRARDVGLMRTQLRGEAQSGHLCSGATGAPPGGKARVPPTLELCGNLVGRNHTVDIRKLC